MGLAGRLVVCAMLGAMAASRALAYSADDPRALLLRGSTGSQAFIRHSFRLVPGADPSNPLRTGGAELVSGGWRLSAGIAGTGVARLARVNRLVTDNAATSRRSAKGLRLAIEPAQGPNRLALEARYQRVRIEDSAPMGAGQRLGDMRVGLALHRAW